MGIFRALIIAVPYTVIQYMFFAASVILLSGRNFTALQLIVIATVFVFLQSLFFWAALLGGIYLIDKSE